MVYFLVGWLLNALSLWLLTRFIAPWFHIGVSVDTYTALLIAALVFGLVNAIVRPIALILSIPFIILSLGLFLFVVNALLFWLVGAIVPGFHVAGFWAAFWGAIWMGIISWAISAIGLSGALEGKAASN
jgi:putative membrane protein